MREIALTRGMVTVVDDADFDELSQWSWCARLCTGKWYAARGNWRGETILMHRQILGLGRGSAGIVDHANGDSLDNRRSNLRVATAAQNCQNQTPQVGRLSRYKGVTWDKSRGLWLASIKQDRQRSYLGRYADEVSAALAYDMAAVERFGAFARPNFLQVGNA